MRMTRSTVQSCATCAATWDDETARYCGRCGQPLRLGLQDHAGTDLHTGVSRRTRLVLIVLGLSAVFVVVALLFSVGLSQVEADPVAPPTAVDLPDRDAMGSEGAGSPPPDADGLSEPGSPVSSHLTDLMTCRPEGCVRWQVDMGTGTAVPGGGPLVHGGQVGGRYR